LRGRDETNRQEQFAKECAAQDRLSKGPDFREGVKAFMEKRAPVFNQKKS